MIAQAIHFMGTLALFAFCHVIQKIKIIASDVTTVVDPIESTRLYMQGSQILSRKGKEWTSKCYPPAHNVCSVATVCKSHHSLYASIEFM